MLELKVPVQPYKVAKSYQLIIVFDYMTGVSVTSVVTAELFTYNPHRILCGS